MKKATWILVVSAAVYLLVIPARSETITLPAGTALHVVLETALSTENTKAGEPFRARLVMPVFANERPVLPIGCMVEGTVARSQEAGRVAGKAQMQLSPETLTFPDGTSVTLSASLTQAQTGDEDLKVDPEEGTVKASGTDGMNTRGVITSGGTAAVLGGVMAGGKGAAIGAGAVGAIALLHQLFKRGKDAVLPPGTEIKLELNRPLSFTTLETPSPSGERVQKPE
ncbi:MAG: TrbI/VirB10 family protein [Acidobacteria bacterium]|nr:TrbI/VirB10 family protein [Acidobacteriota bacterium]